MDSRVLFQTPEDFAARAQIVAAVPDDWCKLDGRLQAPPGLPNVAYDTGIRICEIHDNEPRLQRRRPKPPNEIPLRADPYAIYCLGHHVGFIHFENAGFHVGKDMELSFINVKRFAAFFVGLGYIGSLTFVSWYGDSCREKEGARCSIHLQPWHEIGKHHQDHQPMVNLTWNTESYGKHDRVAPIEAVCQKLELPSLDPTTVSSAW